MISHSTLSEWVNEYLMHIQRITPEVHVRDEEGYKFRSVDNFQRHFDLEAQDLAAMLSRAIENNNLAAGNMYFARRVLLAFAEAYPEDTRQALRVLFDERRDVPERIDDAFERFNVLMERRNKELGANSRSDISLRFLSLLLGFRYPNACNPIKPREWKVFCKFVDKDFNIPKHTSPGYQYKMFAPYIEALRTYIKTIPEIRNLREELTRGIAFRDEEFRWMAQDVIYVTARVVGKSKSGEQVTVVQDPIDDEGLGTGVPSPAAVDVSVSSMRFPLEEYLENLIVKNWSKIDFCNDLELFVDEDGTPGQQFTTEVGTIDLLARDKISGDLVVIELKRGDADYKVIGQILAYIDWVERNLASEGQKVRGVVIVAEGNKALFAAQRQVHGKVSVMYYRVNLDIFPAAESGKR